MTLFDRVIAVDWSGKASPTARSGGSDAIWFQSLGRNATARRDYARTRHDAMAMLCDELRRAVARRERVLIGFDFSFGWPEGFARVIAGADDWRALWDRFEAEIEDAEDNAHAVCAWAETANARFEPPGPFWGCPSADGAPGKKPAALGGMKELRFCEVAMASRPGVRPMSVWQLRGNGAVGAQSLLGVRRLAQLRRAFPTSRVWPFETGWRAPSPKPGEIVIVELYFRLLGDGDTGEADAPKDARQVRAGAQRLADWDAAGELAALFECRDDALRAVVEREEGWTLGA